MKTPLFNSTRIGMLLLGAALLTAAAPRARTSESYAVYVGPVTVDTRRAPSIVWDPQSITNLAGTTAVFTVIAAGTAPLTYQWLCNGANLADGGRISGARTGKLTIANVQSEDYGFYTVVVSGRSSVSSGPALLRVVSVEHLVLSVSNQAPVRFDYTNAAWIEVELTADIANPIVFYTLDGSGPTPASLQYTPPLIVTNEVVIRALAIDPADFSQVEMAPAEVNLWTQFFLLATGTTGGRVEPPRSFHLSNTEATVTAMPDYGWELLSWTGDATGTWTPLSLLMDGDKCVTAEFGLIQRFKLTVKTEGSGTVSGNTQSDYFVTLTAHPTPGWAFLNWMSDASGTSPQTTVTMDRPKEVQAVFGTDWNTNVVGQGTVRRNLGSGPVPFGTVLRLIAVPDPGYYFGLWGGVFSSTVNPVDFTVTSASPTVGALFVALGAEQATLTVLEDGAGVVTRDPQRNAYTKGEGVRLTAYPLPGQDFLGWSGDASGTQNPLTLTVTASQTITATFTHRLALVLQPWPEPAPHGGFRFLLTGDEGDTCRVEASCDLLDWQPLTTLTLSNTAAQFIDLAVTNHSPRFYRAVVP